MLSESSWTQEIIPNDPNGSIRLCIRTTEMCLGLKAEISYNGIYILAFVSKKDEKNLTQKWFFDGKKLTNQSSGPTFCAQAEADNIKMYPCNANEPKQKIEIDNQIFPMPGK